MKRKYPASIAALSLCLFLASPALAEGKGDRAQKAIAEASGKIDAALRVGGAGNAAEMQLRAQALLRAAREDIAHGDKDQAIADANHASTLADASIVEAQRSHARAENAERAHNQAVTAEAQNEANAANVRADQAQQAAAAAQADAAKARATPPPAPVVVITPPPAQPTTTTAVTTQTVSSSSVAPAKPVVRKKVRRVVRHSTAPARRILTKRTTTTVTTTH
jgi:hypothetical protein